MNCLSADGSPAGEGLMVRFGDSSENSSVRWVLWDNARWRGLGPLYIDVRYRHHRLRAWSPTNAGKGVTHTVGAGECSFIAVTERVFLGSEEPRWRWQNMYFLIGLLGPLEQEVQRLQVRHGKRKNLKGPGTDISCCGSPSTKPVGPRDQ